MRLNKKGVFTLTQATTGVNILPSICNPELTRKLVELAKRNFLFLHGIS